MTNAKPQEIAGTTGVVYIAAIHSTTNGPRCGLKDQMTSKTLFRATLTAGLLAGALPATAGPSMSTSLQATTLDLGECLKRGEAIMREAGLTRNLQVRQLSVSGEQGEYTASVRCMPGKDVVLFVVAGPRPDRASKFMTDLRGRF
jgi:hypothetical protein